MDKTFKHIFIWTMLLALVLTLCCCTKRLPTHTVTHSSDTITLHRQRYAYDTIRELQYITLIQRDSIAPVVDSTQRVVAYDRWHYRTLTLSHDQDRASKSTHTDTIRKSSQHSVSTAPPASARRNLAGWQRFTSTVGIITLILIPLYTLYRLRKFII